MIKATWARLQPYNTLFLFHIVAAGWLSPTIASGKHHHATAAESADTCMGGLEGMTLHWI